MKRIVLCALLAPVLLLVVQAVTAAVIVPPTPMPEGGGGLVVLSALITAWELLAIALFATVRAWARAALLFLVAAGLPVNNLIEAILFPIEIPRGHLLPLFAYTLVSGGFFALGLDRLAGGAAPPAAAKTTRPATSWALRFLACVVLYIGLYLAAGQLVWPYVSHFYAGRALPDTPAIVAMQVGRGLVFSAIAYVLMRFLALPPVAAALLVGATFGLLGGVAPLLVPNPYMPESIRYPHMVEVGVSNVIFGLCAAYLLRRSGTAATSDARRLAGAVTAR